MSRWFGSAVDLDQISSFVSEIIGVFACRRDQLRSRVRQAKMMKIATTTAPASIQYWMSKPKTLNF